MIDLPLLVALLAGIAWFAVFVALAYPWSKNAFRRSVGEDPVRRAAAQILARKIRSQGQAEPPWAALFSLARLRERLASAGFPQPSFVFAFAAIRLAAPALFVGLAWAVLEAKSPLHVYGHQEIGLIALAAITGALLPEAMLSFALRHRQRSITRALPEAIDLILICLGSGLTLEMSLRRIIGPVSALSPALGAELEVMLADLTFSPLRGQAFSRFVARCGVPALQDFAGRLAETDRYGLSVAGALKALAGDLRDQAMAEAERRAASLPPKLAVPVVVFFLPVLIVIVLGPSLIRFLGPPI